MTAVSSHQAQVPSVIADYFGCGTRPAISDHPTIGQTFRPGAGWRRYTFHKRVSHAHLRYLRREGVTTIAVDWHGRRADFTIAEIFRAANRPMFGGRVI